MLNNTSLQGRVAFSNFKAAEGDKKAFITFCISWQSPEKEEGSGYYKEKLFRCKAFGKTAEFIGNNFPDKSQILIEGKLDIGNDYTSTTTGELVKGGVEIMVEKVHFVGYKENTGTSNNNTQSHASAPAPKSPAPMPKKPGAAPNVAPKRPGMPPLPRR